MTPRRQRYQQGHLGELVDDYVDERLDAASMCHAGRHLLACTPCREAVDAERAIVTKVRSVRVDPGRHANLVAGLLALDGADGARRRSPQVQVGGAAAVRAADAGAARVRASSARTPPQSAGASAPLTVLRPGVPALYDRRPRRALLAAAMTVAACAGVVTAALSPSPRPQPVAPRLAHTTARETQDEPVAVRTRPAGADLVIAHARARPGQP